jgi:hypothetical protein
MWIAGLLPAGNNKGYFISTARGAADPITRLA